jgi:hypothetical protein
MAAIAAQGRPAPAGTTRKKRPKQARPAAKWLSFAID